MIYADIILPLTLQKNYTYQVPHEFEESCKLGTRVVLQFGKKKMYTGIVSKIHNQKPSYETKEILAILDEYPVVSEIQLQFWTWIAQYYLCTEGEIYKAALPSGLKLESETTLVLTDEADNDIFSDKESQIISAIRTEDQLTISKLQSKFEFNILPFVKKLIESKCLAAYEKLREIYKPKFETYIRVHTNLQNEKNLATALSELNRAKKQAQLLMDVLYMTRYGSDKHDGLRPADEFRKSDILLHAETSVSVLNALIEKGLILEEQREIGRIFGTVAKDTTEKLLSDAQQKAIGEIETQFQEKDVILLHGVTSSGKTEVYINLIKKQLDLGKHVLYLLPEIALTAQIINRLTNIFGERVSIYHSKFSDAERVEIWKTLIEKKSARVILGVRSSIFLPLENVGLIIVDEEHENSYKQYDPAPRYNARDAAIVLAKMHKARVLLGTATPSVETYYNVLTKKYGLVNLFARFGDIQLPEIIIGDVRTARKRKTMKSIFTPELYLNISQALKNNEQVILFQNRRGFAPFMECDECAYVPKCNHCDVSLTFHKQSNALVCHYCGYTEQADVTCKACGNVSMQTHGFGTEKIQEEVSLLFPDAVVARMDTDTTRSKKAFSNLIADFETGKTNILIGTQMISKGLDFDHVSVVGIMNADAMLNFPDFRAYERSFQLMTQVAGRAGRRQKQGKVVIQTSDKENSILKYVITNDFETMLHTQLAERKQYKYPPFYRLIRLSVKHPKLHITDQAAEALANRLRHIFGARVLGPEYPSVGRIKDWYIKQIIIKLEREKSTTTAKEYIRSSMEAIKADDKFRSVLFVPDVDPM